MSSQPTEATLRSTILVVDDAPENIDILNLVLETEYQVKAATNGERALQIINSDAPPDLILLDVVMPVLSGFDVCRIVKANPLRKHIPILFVTSLENWDDEATGLSLGAADYIIKPFRAPIVLARIQTHLRLQRHAQELESRIAERTAALVRNQERLKLASSVFTHAKEAIFIIDAAGTALQVNDAFCQITGYNREEVIGREMGPIVRSGRHNKEFYERRHQILDVVGHWTGEIWNKRKSGDVYPANMTLTVLRDADNRIQNYIGLFEDVSEAKAHQSQLEHVAHHDYLTGLPNHELLHDQLELAISLCRREGRSLAVLLFDIDDFKKLNERYGQEVGDDVLIALAARLTATLPEGSTLSRMGGDAFAAFLMGTVNAQQLENLGLEVLGVIASEFQINGESIRTTASMGLTIYPQDNADADGLIRHAEQAMYIAKQAGKNRLHHFDIAKDAAARSQRESLERIRQALDHEEFVLFYQPKVNMRTGEVIGAEALIRWQHPTKGLIPPGAFLPIVEDDPLGIDIGNWVTGAALRQMAQWGKEGLRLRVSINIGARQLLQDDFVLRLSEHLEAQKAVDPEMLELEILETSALEDIVHVSNTMHTCMTLGVSFSIDDFGTGYSSLTYLKRLPAAVLKIDQSFVRDMLTDNDDMSIVQTVISLAGAFRRKVIAEGVETVAHGTALLAIGCELAQGYGISRPMPAADFQAWAAQWRPDPSWRLSLT